MRVIYFSKYSAIGPSSRYRIYQYLTYLKQSGIHVHISPLFGPMYFRILLLNSKILSLILRLIYVLPRFIVRIFNIPRAKCYDMVIIEHQLFPYLPLFFEKPLFYFNRKVVLEMDDAIYLTHPHKLPELIRRCSHVIVGNRHLSDRVHKYNDKVTVIPTVVGIEKYHIKKSINMDRLVIGWIGLPYNFKYIRRLERVLKDLSHNYPVSVRIISSKSPVLNEIELEFRKWSLEREIEELQEFHIGIMPLFDDEWCRGKCGLKLLQYMAAGLPVVASPVGVNSEIVEDGKNGFLAWDDEDWYKKLSMLCESQTLRESLGQEARKTVEEKYSLSIWGPRLVDFYLKAIKE